MSDNIIKPLVSVCVFTYNSSSTILETLSSIYEQSYKEIELIISDDFSLDNTINVCKEWLVTHGRRFRNVQILTVDFNTGTTANTNRAYHASTGEWIKPIAGDDLLKFNAIEVLLNHCITNHNETCICKLDYFGDEMRIAQKKLSYEPFFEKYSKMDKKGHYNLLLAECALPMPGMIISKKILEIIGFADETYAFSEEWPLYMRIFDSGYDIPYIEQDLIYYRCDNGSLSIGGSYDESVKGQTYKVARQRVFEDGLRFYREYRRPRLLQSKRYLDVIHEDKSYRVIELISKQDKTFFEYTLLYFYRFASFETYKSAFKYLRNSNPTVLRHKLKMFFGIK